MTSKPPVRKPRRDVPLVESTGDLHLLCPDPATGGCFVGDPATCPKVKESAA